MQQFAGYQLERLLGEGATATVYVARRGEEPACALKILRSGAVAAQMHGRFRREIEAMRDLDHPRIVKLLDAGETDGRLWFAMQLLEKRPLADVFVDRFATKGIFSVTQIMTLARGLADSLGYLHGRGLIHRDLKPDNLLADEALDPTVLDLGLARIIERSRMTAEGQIMGTPRFMAPEQVLGKEVGPPADVYAAGLILYEACTGSLPLEDENPFAMALQRTQARIPPPSQARPNMPPGLERIILQCLQADPAGRYPTMTEAEQALADLDPETGALLPGRVMPGAGVDTSLPVAPMLGQPVAGARVQAGSLLHLGENGGGTRSPGAGPGVTQQGGGSSTRFPDSPREPNSTHFSGSPGGPSSTQFSGSGGGPESTRMGGTVSLKDGAGRLRDRAGLAGTVIGGGGLAGTESARAAPGAPPREARPISRRGAVAAAAILGGGLALAALLAGRSGAGAAPLGVSRLRLATSPGRLEVAFETSRAVRSGLVLFPPGNTETEVSEEPSLRHYLALDGLEAGAELKLELKLREAASEAVTRALGAVSLPLEAAALDRMIETRLLEVEGDTEISFATPQECTASVEFGAGQRAATIRTGGLLHAFRLPGVSPGDATPYAVSLKDRTGIVRRPPGGFL